eukprot:gene10556-7328_t
MYIYIYIYIYMREGEEERLTVAGVVHNVLIVVVCKSVCTATLCTHWQQQRDDREGKGSCRNDAYQNNNVRTYRCNHNKKKEEKKRKEEKVFHHFLKVRQQAIQMNPSGVCSNQIRRHAEPKEKYNNNNNNNNNNTKSIIPAYHHHRRRYVHREPLGRGVKGQGRDAMNNDSYVLVGRERGEANREKRVRVYVYVYLKDAACEWVDRTAVGEASPLEWSMHITVTSQFFLAVFFVALIIIHYYYYFLLMLSTCKKSSFVRSLWMPSLGFIDFLVLCLFVCLFEIALLPSLALFSESSSHSPPGEEEGGGKICCLAPPTPKKKVFEGKKNTSSLMIPFVTSTRRGKAAAYTFTVSVLLHVRTAYARQSV